MSGDKKGCDSAVYEEPRECLHKDCEVMITDPVRSQKFCSTYCKDSYHRKERELGKKVMGAKGKHHSSIDSPLNQRVLEFLSDGKRHTSWELMVGARVLDYRSAICDMRKFGFNIVTKLKEVRPDKSRVFEYQLILEV